MDVGSVFQSVLKARLDELGMKPSAAEAAFGLKPDTIRNVLRESQGKAVRRPRIDTAYEICQALQLNFHIGEIEEPKPHFISGHQGIHFAHVPLYEAQLSAGGGHINQDDAVASRMAFRRDWLKSISVTPSDAVLARVADGEMGESMIPTICPGDMVLIDTSRKEIPDRASNSKPRKSPVFAFATDEGARVKRLTHVDNMIVLISDNPDYPPEFIPSSSWGDVNVIGKVVWWGHTAEV